MVIFSLSLTGKNKEDCLKEANRILKIDGRVWIDEPAKKWSVDNREDFSSLINLIEACGFNIIGSVKNGGKFVYVDAIKC